MGKKNEIAEQQNPNVLSNACIAMSRRAAIITQADVARAIRAEKQAGAATVEMRPDGKIIVHIAAPPIAPDLDGDEVIVL
jgi:hypothetical protein